MGLVMHLLCTTILIPYLSMKGATDMASSGDDSFKSDQHHSSERKKRKDAGRVRWQGRDYYALEWIGVQGAIRFDQLQRLLGRESPRTQNNSAILSPSATRNAITRWETKSLIDSEHIVPGEPLYYWLTPSGFQFAEQHVPQYTPKELDMPYLLACNQVRLHLERWNRIDPQMFGDFQECYWVSQRELQSNHPKQKTYLPSGEYWTEARGTLAIEVVIEPLEEAEQQMRDYVQGKLGEYSEVWYFALSEFYPVLNETRERLNTSGIDVSTITLFNADAILLPPKRTKKKE
jgi:hypothetical protein